MTWGEPNPGCLPGLGAGGSRKRAAVLLNPACAVAGGPGQQGATLAFAHVSVSQMETALCGFDALFSLK